MMFTALLTVAVLSSQVVAGPFLGASNKFNKAFAMGKEMASNPLSAAATIQNSFAGVESGEGSGNDANGIIHKMSSFVRACLDIEGALANVMEDMINVKDKIEESVSKAMSSAGELGFTQGEDISSLLQAATSASSGLAGGITNLENVKMNLMADVGATMLAGAGAGAGVAVEPARLVVGCVTHCVTTIVQSVVALGSVKMGLVAGAAVGMAEGAGEKLPNASELASNLASEAATGARKLNDAITTLEKIKSQVMKEAGDVLNGIGNFAQLLEGPVGSELRELVAGELGGADLGNLPFGLGR